MDYCKTQIGPLTSIQLDSIIAYLLLARGDFCRLNILDPEKDRQNISSDLDQTV